MMATDNKEYLCSTSATMHLTLFTNNRVFFYWFFYVQKQMTLQKQEDKLQREKQSETRTTASVLKQDPNT